LTKLGTKEGYQLAYQTLVILDSKLCLRMRKKSQPFCPRSSRNTKPLIKEFVIRWREWQQQAQKSQEMTRHSQL